MMRDVVALILPSIVVAMFFLPPATAMAGRSHGSGAAHVGAGGSFVGHRTGATLAPPTVLGATNSNHRGPSVLTAAGGQSRAGFRQHAIGVGAHRGGVHQARHNRFASTSFVPASTVAVITTPNVYVPPSYDDVPPYDSAPDYGRAMTYSPASTVTVTPSPPAPPMPNVVEYSTGRYELRGDGFTIPYTWVWIPNPPPAPPPSSTPGGTPQARRTQLYRWTDTDGVAHWTDRIESVPERYRAEAALPRAP